MAEQPGAKEASVTEQSADRQKQVSCFSSSHTLLPIWNARTHAHARSENARRTSRGSPPCGCRQTCHRASWHVSLTISAEQPVTE